MTRVKGAFVDYMGLLESQDPLVQRQETIYSAVMSFIFNSLNPKNKSCPACLNHNHFLNEGMHELVHRVTYPFSTCRVNVGYQASRACRDSQEGPYLVQRWIYGHITWSYHQTEMNKILQYIEGSSENVRPSFCLVM